MSPRQRYLAYGLLALGIVALRVGVGSGGERGPRRDGVLPGPEPAVRPESVRTGAAVTRSEGGPGSPVPVPSDAERRAEASWASAIRLHWNELRAAPPPRDPFAPAPALAPDRSAEGAGDAGPKAGPGEEGPDGKASGASARRAETDRRAASALAPRVSSERDASVSRDRLPKEEP